MDFNNISWSYIMDWVVFASCIVLIITVVFDIVKSVKDKSGLSDEHKFLNKEHSRIENLIREEAYKTEHTIEKDNSQIIGIVTNIDKTIF